MRRFFFWRVGALLVLLFTFAASGCMLLVWLAAGGVQSLPREGFFPFRYGPLLAFAFGGLGLYWTIRALRRAAAPIGDLMEAAGRVEEGDYSVRVAERGPREMRDLARAFNAMASQLQRDEEQRRNLLADVTHELRTPLTVMQGGLEALLDGVYPRDDEHLAPILDETRVLSRLIDDLRTLALAESGALKLHREPTDLAILIEETLASFRAQADAAGVALDAILPDDLPILDADPVRVREVITNLISNALRHTPEGGKVEASASANGNRAAIVIRDTGSGISPEDLPHVFDRFYKSEKSRGTGLGLAIAKNLVTAHGGEITAESQMGGGATFRFTLPVSSDSAID